MTPEWASHLIVDTYFPDLGPRDLVVEPSCGRGAFLKAVPEGVRAIGVELDPRLAEEARENTGRTIITGDFRLVDLPEEPTVIVGNPPYKIDVIADFLERARTLLPDEGRCGFLLPAYAMQNHRRVIGWAKSWSMRQDLVPRRLFPYLRLPLLFVMFKKERVKTLVGFTLYQEAVDFHRLPMRSKLILIDGRPRRSVWRAVIDEALKELGGQGTLEEIYGFIEPRRPTENTFWKEKVRQVLQVHFEPVDRGVWRLAS